MGDETRFLGRVPTSVALALLESLRAADTPTDPDALAETDLPLNLQRRLGLSRVVVDQIKRYAERRGDGISAREVASLFELIGRRADAGRVFAAAGRRLAEAQLEGRGFAARLGARALPRRARERLALRRVRRIARVVSPESDVKVEARPATLIVEGCLPARALQEGEVGCSLLEGAIAQVLDAYAAGRYDVVHDECEGRDEPRCRWVLEPASGAAEDEPERAIGHPGPAPEDVPLADAPVEANGR